MVMNCNEPSIELRPYVSDTAKIDLTIHTNRLCTTLNAQ